MYSEYNIIPLGDHCAIPIILKELNLRKCSYPFDWVTMVPQVVNTNIFYNVTLLHELYKTDQIDSLTRKFIGNAFNNTKKMNTTTKIWFPHDNGKKADLLEKYKRRFFRLKHDLPKKNIFVLLTRHYHIDEPTFTRMTESLLQYNKESILLFISGTPHTYADNPRVIFKYIEYDISKFYDYDAIFRKEIKDFLSHLFLT